MKKYGKIPPVYPNGWYKLLDSIFLKKGESRYVTAIGQHFAVYRGEDNIVRILEAYCPHLGANLGIGGKVVGDTLECPFHGWRFDGEGTCKHIPYAASVPKMCKTKAWKSKEVNGMICVFFDAEGRDPEWYPDTIKEVEDGTYTYQGRTENHIQAHIQEIPENGSDTAHLNILHTPAMYFSKVVNHKWEGKWSAGEEHEKHVTHVIIKEHMTLFGYKIPFSGQEAHISQVGPALVYLKFDTIFGKMVMFETVTPIGPLYLQADHILFAERKIPQFFVKMAFIMLVNQFERDIPIWGNKTYVHNPLVVKEDGNILGFRRWFAQFYSANSPTIESLQKATLDW